jgi:transposase
MSGGTALADASWSGCTDGLAFVLIIGRAERFQCGKQIAAYLGLVPLEDSSGNRRRLGHITKQGSSILRFLLVEAAQVTARSIPEFKEPNSRINVHRHVVAPRSLLLIWSLQISISKTLCSSYRIEMCI